MFKDHLQVFPEAIKELAEQPGDGSQESGDGLDGCVNCE